MHMQVKMILQSLQKEKNNEEFFRKFDCSYIWNG